MTHNNDTPKITQLLGRIAELEAQQRTLGDDFAMAALTGIIARIPSGVGGDIYKECSKAFEVSDVMMTIRKERIEKERAHGLTD